jgi:hypothetical protein
MNNFFEAKKTMWQLKMKSRIKSKFLFFTIPIVLLTLGLRFFGSEDQFNDFLPFLAGAMFIIMLYNFKKTEKANIIITAQKEELDKKNQLIEEKNKDILDSIRYARRIQTSLLPTEKYIWRILNKENKSPGV